MPEPGERVDEGLGEVAGVRGVAVAGLVRDVGQRTAHLVLDGVRREERLGVHRVEVVDAVEEAWSAMPRARRARAITSRITGPRRLPTWTVPDGVLQSLTTCGPSTEAASSSAQSMARLPGSPVQLILTIV